MSSRIWPRLARQRAARGGLLLLVLLGGVALLADFLASDLPLLARFEGTLYVLPALRRPPELARRGNQELRRDRRPGDWFVMPLCEYGPEQQPEILRPPPASPDAEHWLGTDDRGRDVFARAVHGTRVSLAVGFGAVALYALLGLLLGLLGGYLGGWVDWTVCRLAELGLTLPTFFVVLIVMALTERSSVSLLILVIGATRWPEVARLVRAEVLRLRELEFVQAARASGATPLRVVRVHLLPNALGPVIVHAAFGVGSAILFEAALSFLGFGVPPPRASWGELLGQALEHSHCWWLLLVPGGLIFAAVTALNFLGEGLAQALDPRRGTTRPRG
ncbi:MAG: ABC transporter permease [Deltaproteobacteria bacterium]|nr:ABC transporter permease [Deltaproteobacteria bacterium]